MRVFFLLVVQLLVIYAKWFLRIATYYGDIADCFKKIHCGRESAYRNLAFEAQADAFCIEKNLKPVDPVKYIQKFITLAATMESHHLASGSRNALVDAIHYAESHDIDFKQAKEMLERHEKQEKEMLEQNEKQEKEMLEQYPASGQK